NLPDGAKLAVITNAGGPGIMTTDAILDSGGELAELGPETKRELTELLPEHSSVENPVDVLGDAGSSRYKDAIRICQEDDNVDG
ncbi:MAG: CoA-binding protein, partial [Candidatus Bipolaricaulia bacterium]